VQTEDGVLLKPATTTYAVGVDVAYASLRSATQGQPPTDEQMRAAAREKAAERFKRTGGK